MAERIHKELKIGSKTVVYDFDGTYPGNNLKIFDGEECVFQLNDIIRMDDCVTVLNQIGDKTISFATWNGLYFEMDVESLQILKKEIGK